MFIYASTNQCVKNPIARASPNPQGLQGPIPWQMSNGNTNRTAVGFAGAQPQRPKTGDHLRATPNSYDQTVTQSIQQNNLSYQQVNDLQRILEILAHMLLTVHVVRRCI